MSEQWQSFVSNHPAQPMNNYSLEKGCLFDLSETNALLELSGEDVRTYLQGQLTNDINAVTNEESQLSGYCNPKGRLLALFRIFAINEKIYLQFPAELLPKIQKRLQMFVMMSKVTIRDLSEEFVSIGLAGKTVSNYLKQKFTDLTDENNSMLTQDGISIITISANNSVENPRYLCVGSSDAVQTLSTELFSEGVLLVENNGWDLLNVQSGLPCVVENTVEAFVPQMLNLHLLNGINFKKGCYTGQEVVARMHYLGKLKRLMYQLKFDSDKLPEAGDSLYSPQSTSGQGAGKIVLSSWLVTSQSSSKEVLALAVLEISNAENDAIYLDENCTIKASIVDLPYNLNNDEV